MEEIVTPGTYMLKGYDLKSGANHWLLEVGDPHCLHDAGRGRWAALFRGLGAGKGDYPGPTWEQWLANSDKNHDGVIDETDVGPEAWSYMKGLDIDFDGKLTKADFDKLPGLHRQEPERAGGCKAGLHRRSD